MKRKVEAVGPEIYCALGCLAGSSRKGDIGYLVPMVLDSERLYLVM